MFVFITSFVSPHVKPLLEEISKIRNERIIVIQCIEITEERKKMGYSDSAFSDHFEIISLKKENARSIELINKADVVDCAWHLMDLLYKRVKDNKLTFLENERLLKKGILKIFDTRLWKQIYFNLFAYRKNVYFLSTGDYAANDYRLLGFNHNKILRFGYFPKTYYFDNVLINKTMKEPLRCLWVGRFISWKKPIDVLKSIKAIPQDKIQLKMLGDGILRKNIEKHIKKNNLNNIVLTGMVPIDEVRNEMLKADVLISSSTKKEGWGAVINEAMNSGCAVISSDGSGAVPNLIIDGYNGFVYRSGNFKQLHEKLNILTNDKKLVRTIGRNAYTTTTKLWNEQVAAERLMQWIALHNQGIVKIFEDGPCSKVYNNKLIR